MPTDSLAAVFAFAFVVSIGAVVSPGPVSAAIVSEAPRHGWRVGPLVAIGHVSLELIIVILIGMGLSAGLASPWVSRLIAIGGGVVLAFIGFSYLHGAWRGSMKLPEAGETDPEHTAGGLFSLGLITTLSNPFWYAWWVTVAAAYLAQADMLGAMGPVAFYLGHISADLAWDSFLAAAMSTGGRWLSQRRYRILILGTGAFMLVLGALFLRTGLTG